MARRSKVVLRDRGMKLIRRRLGQAKGMHVVAGFTAEAGPVIDRAIYAEFGTANAPARPFMRIAFESNRVEYKGMLSNGLQDITLLKATPEKVLTRVGLRAEGDIKRTITKLREPPNAPSTIARKGSSNPLIDTGLMRAGVSNEVRRGV